MSRAFQNLLEVQASLDSLQIPFWLDGGTLLGAYRDNDFPPDDHNDIDLSTWAEHKPKIPSLIASVTAKGFRLYHHWTGDPRAPGQAQEVSFTRDGLKIDVFFFERKGPNSWHLLFSRDGAGYRGTPVVVPARLIDPLSPILFHDHQFMRPADTDGYLTCRYGDWRTPIHRKTYQANRHLYFLALQPDFPYWPDVSDITICITAFERPTALANLLVSIRAHYPDIRILIGDNSYHPTRPPGQYAYIPLPPDCGVAESRNQLLARVTTPYVMFADDDFLFTDETRIERLRDHLGWFDLVAGMVLARNGRDGHYEGLLHIEDGTLNYIPKPLGFHDLPVYEIVYNFFVAKTDKVREIGWDSELKLAEHSEYFIRARGKLNVGYDSSVRVRHPESATEIFKTHRLRGSDFAALAFAKHGINRSIGFKGEVWP
jgi:hypothetical protein